MLTFGMFRALRARERPAGRCAPRSSRGFTFWLDAGHGRSAIYGRSIAREGQKCVVYGLERRRAVGRLWKCVAVVDDPVGPNDPCVTMDAWNSGLDTCEKGTMCWQYGGEGLAGIACRRGGSRAEPSCSDPSQYCRILGDDDLTPYLCFTQCDPVAQDCPAAQVCRPDYYWNLIFSCYAQGGGADGLFAACTAASCQPGLVCLPADTAVECDPGLEGCCTPYCDFGCPRVSWCGAGVHSMASRSRRRPDTRRWVLHVAAIGRERGERLLTSRFVLGHALGAHPVAT